MSCRSSKTDGDVVCMLGACSFITLAFLFGNLACLELFIRERLVFFHEKASDYYRVSAYFLGRTLCDIIRKDNKDRC